MAGIETFFDAPSEELLERFTKAQLLQIAEHYGVAITGKKKQEVKECLIAYLEKGAASAWVDSPWVNI